MAAGFRLGSGAAELATLNPGWGGLRQAWLRWMAQSMGYLLVACREPAVKSRGQGRVSCTDTSPPLDLLILVPNNFVIDCVCWVVWACLNVVCWHGPLLETSLSRACVGGRGIVPAKGVVRTLLFTGTVLESTAGMFLRIRSDILTRLLKLCYFSFSLTPCGPFRLSPTNWRREGLNDW